MASVFLATLLLGMAGVPLKAGGDALLLSPAEQKLLDLINEHRVQHNVSPLELSPRLTEAARWMSQDMAATGVIGHTDSLQRSSPQRMSDFGYDCLGSWGETVAVGGATADATFEQWMNSPPHNAIMLDPRFKVAGVGQAHVADSRYGWYWVADFGACVDASGSDGDDGGGTAATAAPSPTPSPAPTAEATPTVVPSAQGHLENCPLPDKWSLAVWDGEEALTGDALATCGAGAVTVAYGLEPLSGRWLPYFAGREQISELTTLQDMQGIVALGGEASAARQLEAAGLASGTEDEGRVLGCPPPNRWAIAVWIGQEVATGDALDTCGVGAVKVAYWLDLDSQQWLPYVAGRPDISRLPTLSNMQAIVALGAAASP